MTQPRKPLAGWERGWSVWAFFTLRRPNRSTRSSRLSCPAPPRFYTHASGVAEVGVGALLLAPPTRKLGGLAAVALFLGVLPGNINMVRLWWDKPWYMRAGAIARLPLQIPMITTALKVYRNS